VPVLGVFSVSEVRGQIAGVEVEVGAGNVAAAGVEERDAVAGVGISAAVGVVVEGQGIQRTAGVEVRAGISAVVVEVRAAGISAVEVEVQVLLAFSGVGGLPGILSRLDAVQG